jgi:hypothetical protein
MWAWLVGIFKSLWDPNWEFKEIQRRRFEEIFRRGDEDMKKRDEARRRQQ